MTPLHLGFMVLINLIWGFALIAAKVSLDHFPPLLFAALRFTLIVLVLFPFLKIHRGRMKEVIIIALCAGPVGFGFFFLGLALSNASVVAVTSQLGVPFATIMSIVFLKEEVHWRRWLGISLSFLGVMVISFDPAVFTYIDGLLFVVASALVGSVGTIYQFTEASKIDSNAPEFATFVDAVELVGESWQWSWWAKVSAPLLAIRLPVSLALGVQWDLEGKNSFIFDDNIEFTATFVSPWFFP